MSSGKAFVDGHSLGDAVRLLSRGDALFWLFLQAVFLVALAISGVGVVLATTDSVGSGNGMMTAGVLTFVVASTGNYVYYLATDDRAGEAIAEVWLEAFIFLTPLTARHVARAFETKTAAIVGPLALGCACAGGVLIAVALGR